MSEEHEAPPRTGASLAIAGGAALVVVCGISSCTSNMLTGQGLVDNVADRFDIPTFKPEPDTGRMPKSASDICIAATDLDPNNTNIYPKDTIVFKDGQATFEGTVYASSAGVACKMSVTREGQPDEEVIYMSNGYTPHKGAQLRRTQIGENTCFTNNPRKPAGAITLCEVDSALQSYKSTNAQLAEKVDKLGNPVVRIKKYVEPTPLPTPEPIKTPSAMATAEVTRDTKYSTQDSPAETNWGLYGTIAGLAVGVGAASLALLWGRKRVKETKEESEAQISAVVSEKDGVIQKTKAELAAKSHEAEVHAKNLQQATDVRAKLTQLEGQKQSEQARLVAAIELKKGKEGEKQNRITEYKQRLAAHEVAVKKYNSDLQLYLIKIGQRPFSQITKPVEPGPAPQAPTFAKDGATGLDNEIIAIKDKIKEIDRNIQQEKRTLAAINKLVN